MQTITVAQAAEKWGLTPRRVRILCAEGKVAGTRKEGHAYRIPADAEKPLDGRTLRYAARTASPDASRFAKIDALKAQLARRRPLTQGELERLRDQFAVEYTYNSNAIEGSTLTLQETALALSGLTVAQKPLKEHLEAVGHRDAFQYVQRIAAGKTALSEKIIREIHALVLIDRPEDKGRYRDIPVRIVGADAQPPQPWLVPQQMAELVRKYKRNKQHPIERTARFHLDFERIHPFVDGNGRTGRLLLNLMLMQKGYPPVDVKFTDRRRYYACFDDYAAASAPDRLVKLVCEYLEEQLGMYLEVLK